ncbi:MAG: hypothetical protein WC829_18245 [Hyphomicrobium sp.]|jgi:hypothetical protein
MNDFTTTIDPEHYHVLRANADAEILASLTVDQRCAIRRLLCPLCALGAGVTIVSTADEPRHDHTVDGQTTQCKAGRFFNDLYGRVEIWKSTQERGVAKNGAAGTLDSAPKKEPPNTMHDQTGNGFVDRGGIKQVPGDRPGEWRWEEYGSLIGKPVVAWSKTTGWGIYKAGEGDYDPLSVVSIIP